MDCEGEQFRLFSFSQSFLKVELKHRFCNIHWQYTAATAQRPRLWSMRMTLLQISFTRSTNMCSAKEKLTNEHLLRRHLELNISIT